MKNKKKGLLAAYGMVLPAFPGGHADRCISDRIGRHPELSG